MVGADESARQRVRKFNSCRSISLDPGLDGAAAEPPRLQAGIASDARCARKFDSGRGRFVS
jgi:hypothetical protein